jgi:hypothetical protein
LQGSRRGKTLGEFLLSTASDLYLGSEKTRSARSYWRAYFCERDEKTKKPIRWATGVVDDGSRRSHTEAHRATVAWLASGGSRGPSMAAKNTVITTNVDEIGADFWVWDKSPYLAMVLSHDPHAVCREHVVNMEACYRNHVRPVLGEVPLDQVTPGQIDDLITNLITVKGLSSQTAHHVKMSLVPIFQWAKRRRMIEVDPTKDVVPLKVRVKKPRQSFTLEEAQALLNWDTVQQLCLNLRDLVSLRQGTLCRPAGRTASSLV